MVVAEISGGVPVLMDSVVMSSVFGKDTTGIIPVVELDELLPDDVASSMESVFTWDFMTTSLVLDVDVEVLLSEGVGLLDFSLDATEPIDDVRDHNDDEGVCPRWDVATDSLSSGTVKELEKEPLLMLEDLELVLSLGNDEDDDEEEEEEAVLVRPLDINDS